MENPSRLYWELFQRGIFHISAACPRRREKFLKYILVEKGVVVVLAVLCEKKTVEKVVRDMKCQA